MAAEISWAGNRRIRRTGQPFRVCTVGVESAGCVWALEAVYDEEEDALLLFWASMCKWILLVKYAVIQEQESGQQFRFICCPL